jgi:nitronate monooxygenase
VGKEMIADGDTEKGTMAAGQCIGLIRDIPTCRELLDRIMAEAEEIINTRLARMLGDG